MGSKASIWNPWHGCHKFSTGCQHCYVYRTDGKYGKDSSVVAKTEKFNLPVQQKKNKTYKIPSGNLVYTCFTSDFLVEDVELVRLFEKEDDYLEKSRLLMNAYNQLSANQRNAIYLYFIKEFSWDEMAVSLDINPHSCMNLVARAVAKLQRMVAGEKKK